MKKWRNCLEGVFHVKKTEEGMQRKEKGALTDIVVSQGCTSIQTA